MVKVKGTASLVRGGKNSQKILFFSLMEEEKKVHKQHLMDL